MSVYNTLFSVGAGILLTLFCVALMLMMLVAVAFVWQVSAFLGVILAIAFVALVMMLVGIYGEDFKRLGNGVD